MVIGLRVQNGILNGRSSCLFRSSCFSSFRWAISKQTCDDHSGFWFVFPRPLWSWFWFSSFRECSVVWVGRYASSGLLGPDCVGRPNFFVTKSTKLSAIDVTVKVIYERFVLGPGRFAFCHHTLRAHTPTSLSLTISQSPRLSFRSSVLDPPFFLSALSNK